MAISFSFEAIGTPWRIDIADDVAPADAHNLEKTIRTRIDAFDATYSRFRADSRLVQASRKAGRYKLPDDAAPLFDLYKKLYEATDGKVTPLVGNMLEDAGYDAQYSLQPKRALRAAPKWEDVLDYTFPFLSVTQPVTIDVGAAGKGYVVDIVAALLEDAGVHSYIIDASGDMLQRTTNTTNNKLKIGLEHPLDADLAIGVVEIGNESICGSASNRRSWAGLHHIMDPSSAKPVEDIIATWVVAKSAMEADGLATALFFTPAQKLLTDFLFDYVVIHADMSVEASPRLKTGLF